MTLIMTIFIVLPQIEGVTLLLGGWWLEAAKRGGPDTLPVINLSPEVRRKRALSLHWNHFSFTRLCRMSDYLTYFPPYSTCHNLISQEVQKLRSSFIKFFSLNLKMVKKRLSLEMSAESNCAKMIQSATV